MEGPLSLIEQLNKDSEEEKRRRKGNTVIRRDGERKVYAEPEPDIGWAGVGAAPGPWIEPIRVKQKEEPLIGRNTRNLFKQDYGTGYTGDIPESFSPERRLKIFEQETGLHPSVLDDEQYARYVNSPFNLPPRLSMDEMPTDDGFHPSIKRWGGEEKVEVEEEVDPDGMSYEKEEVLEELRSSGKKVSTPQSFARDPQAVLEKSRETGEPWQDILVQHYIDANPWLDQHKVRKAVYSVADKHYEKWKNDGAKGDYNKNLSSSFSRRGSGRGRGRGGSRGSSGKSSKKNLATSMLSQDPELKRMVNLLGDANSFSQGVSQKEMNKFYDKIAQSSDGTIEDAGAAEEAMKRSLGKRELNADTYVDTMMRMYETGPEDQKKRYNRSAVQSMVQKKLFNNVVDMYNSGDQRVVALVDQYKTGTKPGKPAFNQAASDIFMRYGLEDVSLTRGRRGAGTEYKRKAKNK